MSSATDSLSVGNTFSENRTFGASSLSRGWTACILCYHWDIRWKCTPRTVCLASLFVFLMVLGPKLCKRIHEERSTDGFSLFQNSNGVFPWAFWLDCDFEFIQQLQLLLPRISNRVWIDESLILPCWESFCLFFQKRRFAVVNKGL